MTVMSVMSVLEYEKREWKRLEGDADTEEKTKG